MGVGVAFRTRRAAPIVGDGLASGAKRVVGACSAVRITSRGIRMEASEGSAADPEAEPITRVVGRGGIGARDPAGRGTAAEFTATDF